MWNMQWVSIFSVYGITLVHATFPDREPEGMPNPKSVRYARAKDGLSRRPTLVLPGLARCVSNVPIVTAKGVRFERRIGGYRDDYGRRGLTEVQV